MTLAATALVARGRRRGFPVHYALVLTQQAVGNTVFHGTTRAPGRMTAAGLVLPLWVRITRLAQEERLLHRRDVAAAVALGGAVHAVTVARQVYFVGRGGLGSCRLAGGSPTSRRRLCQSFPVG